ncbi:hypothetical protein BHF71_08720 [Vulcanibacillus modesticaldus]|uniref:DUF8042 domain-containing protein n=1 Tax=Vulcanibacillus modesticaldus TaxID=337097 RepID=A0A1D2YUV7_9BACI|nr:hypothetical protein [Vulcanibacillus modesticaldus]OEF99494.1 hypothetical protein BHF71_08720 [Vulcanibacillus modesticaldus]
MGHNHDSKDNDHYYDNTILQDNQYVFLRHYAQMLETLDSGVLYILTRIKDENTFDLPMFQDVIEALKAIQNANILSSNLMKTVDKDAYNIILSFEEMAPIFEEVVKYQQEEDVDKLVNILVNDLFPKYLAWSTNVNEALTKYLQN